MLFSFFFFLSISTDLNSLEPETRGFVQIYNDGQLRARIAPHGKWSAIQKNSDLLECLQVFDREELF